MDGFRSSLLEQSYLIGVVLHRQVELSRQTNGADGVQMVVAQLAPDYWDLRYRHPGAQQRWQEVKTGLVGPQDGPAFG